MASEPELVLLCTCFSVIYSCYLCYQSLGSVTSEKETLNWQLEVVREDLRMLGLEKKSPWEQWSGIRHCHCEGCRDKWGCGRHNACSKCWNIIIQQNTRVWKNSVFYLHKYSKENVFLSPVEAGWCIRCDVQTDRQTYNENNSCISLPAWAAQ